MTVRLSYRQIPSEQGWSHRSKLLTMFFFFFVTEHYKGTEADKVWASSTFVPELWFSPSGLELKSSLLWPDKQIKVSGDLIKDNTVDF